MGDLMNEEYESLRAQPSTEAPKKPEMEEEQSKNFEEIEKSFVKIVQRYGTMFLEIIEAETAKDLPIIKAYLMDELLNDEKYNVSIEELTAPSYRPQRKQSLLDLAIDNARKKLADIYYKETFVPVCEYMNLPSSKSLMYFNRQLKDGHKAGIFFDNRQDDKAPEVPEVLLPLLDLFASMIMESKKSTVTLKLTDLQKKTGVDISKYIGLKKGETLSTPEIRLRFNTLLRLACAKLIGVIEGRDRFFSVMEFKYADINFEYVTYSSPFFKEILGILKNGDKKLIDAKNRSNTLMRAKAASLSSQAYAAFWGITQLISSRGEKPDATLKGKREELTAGDPTAVSIRTSWKSFLGKYCPDTYRHLQTLPKNNKNTFLNRLCNIIFSRQDGKKPVLLDPSYCRFEEVYEGPYIVKAPVPTWSVLASTDIVIVHHGKKKKRG